MTLSHRDKMLLLVLPAVLLVIGYATYGMSTWREKSSMAEKGLAATREKLPGPAEEQRRREKLASAVRETTGENEAIDLLKQVTAAYAMSLATEKADLADAKARVSGSAHRDELAKLKTQHTDEVQKLERDFTSNRKEAERKHADEIAALWATSNGPHTDRTERIELLNKVLARYGLTILDATDETRADAAPPRLQAVMKTATEFNGHSPPRPRQVKVRGRYSQLAGAIESLSRGDAWAVPLAITMKPAADGLFEWTLTVWV